MPLPKNRSTKYRKMMRKTAKGPKPVFIKRISFRASCAVCKSKLAGVKPGSKTEKSVFRKFGGHLCHSCTSHVIKEASRVKEKIKSIDDVELIYRKYVQQIVK